MDSGSEISSALPGCYLLVILGEPLCDNHKEKILQRVAKGLLSWDTEVTQCDLKHLEQVCDNLKTNDRKSVETSLLLQHSTDKLAVEVLFNPQIFALKQCLRNLLLSPTGHKHIIYAGYSFTGSGSWILQDGIFKFQDFVNELSDPHVTKVLSHYPPGCSLKMHLHCSPIGDWVTHNLDDQPFSRLINLSLNPPDSPNGVPGASNLLEFIENSLETLEKEESLESSSLIGNIRFERPTMYIFPSGQGDCSLFGITGFTMLIDGGFNRFPCFWKFVRHIERLDSIMLTRINESNLWGILSLLRGKQASSMFLKIGYVFCNIGGSKSNGSKDIEGKPEQGGNGGLASIQSDPNDLIISIIDVGNEIASRLKQIGCNPHQCLRESTPSPLTLYHKVGHGTLEMYVLSPPRDSRLLKDFLSHWNSNRESLPVVRTRSTRTNDGQSGQDIAIPISDVMSICCLIVWKPADPSDRLTRILFPGSAPQSQIMEGLSSLKELDLFATRVCTRSSIEQQSSKHKKTVKSSVRINENVGISSTRYRSVSPTMRKSRVAYTKQTSTDLGDKGGDSSESQSSPVRRKVNISSVQKSENLGTRVTKEAVKKTIAEDKKVTKATTERKVKTRTSSTSRSSMSSAKTVSKNLPSESTNDKMQPVTRPVRPRISNKNVPAKVSEKIIEGTKKTKTKDSGKDKTIETDAGDSVDKKRDTHEIYSEDDHRDSGKGSEDASPRKLPFLDHLRDEVEPDSLEYNDIYGNVEISKDSLEHSEDEVITGDSRSTSQMDQVTSREDADDEMKSRSSPIEPIDSELQSAMMSSLSSNISEMTVISGEKNDDSASDLEVASLTSKINDNSMTVRSLEMSKIEENRRRSNDMSGSHRSLQSELQEMMMEDDKKSIGSSSRKSSIVEQRRRSSQNVQIDSMNVDTQLTESKGYFISDSRKSSIIDQFKGESELTESHEYQSEGKIEDNTDNQDIESVRPGESETKKKSIDTSELDLETSMESQKIEMEDSMNNKAETELLSGDSIQDEIQSTVGEKRGSLIFEKNEMENFEENSSDNPDLDSAGSTMEDKVQPSSRKGSRKESIDSKSIVSVDENRRGDNEKTGQRKDSIREMQMSTNDTVTDNDTDTGRESDVFVITSSEIEEPQLQSISFSNDKTTVDTKRKESIKESSANDASNVQNTQGDEIEPKQISDNQRKYSIDVKSTVLTMVDDRETVDTKITTKRDSIDTVNELDVGHQEGKQSQSETLLTSSKRSSISSSDELQSDTIVSMDSRKSISSNVTGPDNVLIPLSVQDSSLQENVESKAGDGTCSKVMTEQLIERIEKKSANDLVKSESISSSSETNTTSDSKFGAFTSVDEETHAYLEDSDSLTQDGRMMTSMADQSRFDGINQKSHSIVDEREKISETKHIEIDQSEVISDSKLIATMKSGSGLTDRRESEVQMVSEFIEVIKVSEPSASLDNSSFTNDHIEISSKVEGNVSGHETTADQADGLTISVGESSMTNQTSVNEVISTVFSTECKSETDTKLETPKSITETFGYDVGDSQSIEHEHTVGSMVSEPQSTTSLESKTELISNSEINKERRDTLHDLESVKNLGEQIITTYEPSTQTGLKLIMEAVGSSKSDEKNAASGDYDDGSFKLGSSNIVTSILSPSQGQTSDKSDSTNAIGSVKSFVVTEGSANLEKAIKSASNEFSSSTIHHDTKLTTKVILPEMIKEEVVGKIDENEAEMISDLSPKTDDFIAKVETSPGTSLMTTQFISSADMPSVHLRRSAQIAGQVLYEVPDEEDTVDSPRSEKKQIDLPSVTTIFTKNIEVFNNKPEDNVPISVSILPEVGNVTSEVEDSSMVIASPQDSKSGLCCFPRSVEVDGTKKEKEEKIEKSKSTDGTGTSVTFQSQELTEQQIKEKEATLKEWGNPLGLPKPTEPTDSKVNRSTSKSRAKSSDRTGSTRSYSSSTRRSASSTDSIKPIYLDLAYIPHHGDQHYCNADYFKKIRARYYVLSGVNPSKEVLDALIEGKQSWEDKNTEVTLIPSHESEVLCLWMATNQKVLETLNIEVAPSASRCSVILQDQESSCSAYRVEF